MTFPASLLAFNWYIPEDWGSIPSRFKPLTDPPDAVC